MQDGTMTIRVNEQDKADIQDLINFYKKQNIELTKTSLIKKLIRDALDEIKK